MQGPHLLYHAQSPVLYPTNDPAQSLLTVRFAAAVRVASVRITPEGVQSPTGPGVTFPSEWTGELFLNISPSDPVNALGRSKVEYNGEAWPVDYEIGMAEGVSTRLVSLLAPIQSLTISIYGYHAASSSRPHASVPQHDIDLSSSYKRPGTAKEDHAWVSAWAGGVDGLLDLLGSKAEEEVKQRALRCLQLLFEAGSLSPQAVVEREAAVAYLLQCTPEPQLAAALLANPDYAEHPSVRAAIPPSHESYALLSGQLRPDEQRKRAWLEVGSPIERNASIALRILARKDGSRGENSWEELMEVQPGVEGSNLSRLLTAADIHSSRENGEMLRSGLDVLDGALSQRPDKTDSNPYIDPADRIALEQLASVLPRLVLTTNILIAASRSIGLPMDHAMTVARTLFLCSTEVIGGILARDMAKVLAEPFLEHLPPDSPYRVALSWASVTPPTPLRSSNNDSDTRRLHRLSSTLTPAQPTPSAIVHSGTPAELVHLIAPSLFALLSTAPQPLLGIPALANPTPESQANAWAGKVYSSNEFRERAERADRGNEARVGLGIRGMSSGSVASAVGSGGGIGGAGVTGQAGRMSRPASRHVDEYAR